MGDEIVTPELDIEDDNVEEQDSSCNPGVHVKIHVVHKRKALTLKQKADIIAAYDENPLLSKVELARRFNLSRTTLHSIVAKRDAISESMKKFGSYSSMRKKSRTSPFQEIEGKLLLWMEYAKDLNLPVNGFTLRRQAMAIAKDLGFEKFTASNGWIERFKSRHNDYWKACKTSGTAAKEVEKKDHLPIEPTVEIKEEPTDYASNPSTSSNNTNEEFILPHEENSWATSDSVVEPQFTLSVANLSSPNGPETSDGEQSKKKRKPNPNRITSTSTFVPPVKNGPRRTSQSPVYNFDEFPMPSSFSNESRGEFPMPSFSKEPRGEYPTPNSFSKEPRGEYPTPNSFSKEPRGESSTPGSASKESRKDQFDVFGEYIAAKLRSLDRRSCAFAQKAIGDIIFDAEMGKYLTEGHNRHTIMQS